jgi:hypothetical protein
MTALENPSRGVKRPPGNADQSGVSRIGSFEHVAAYVDTLELFFRYSLPPGIRMLDRIQGRRIRTEPCADDHEKIVGHRVIVHQPKLAALELLDRLQASHNGVLCRFDIAADFMFATEAEAEAFGRRLTTNVIMRWRRPGPMHDFEGGAVNWVRQIDRSRRSNRDLEMYADRLSKLSGKPCAHLELKILRAAACRRVVPSGRVKDILAIDPAMLFAHHLALSDIGERHAERMIRATVDADREAFAGRTVSEFTDRYRSQLRRFAATVLRKNGADRAQTVKDRHPRRRIETTTFALGIPARLTPF